MVMRDLPTLPPERCGVFLAREAHAVGWTPDALERAVAAGRILRLRRGVFVAPDVGEFHPADRARRDRARRSIAAALVTSGSVVTGLSAATGFGWPVWAPRERACLTVTNSRSTSIAGDVHLHRGGLAADAWIDLAGFRVTTPTRTVVDVAREFGAEAGLVVADAAVAAGATSSELLRREVDRLCGRRGIPLARPLPELVDARSESVLESRSRWQFVRHELPRPTPQMWIYALDGRFLGRTDFYWQEGVVGEVDGAGKLEEAGARKALLQRQLALGRVGLRITRWGESDLRSFDPVARWIREELAAAVADPRPRRWIASPRRLGSETAVPGVHAAVSDPSRR